MNYLFWNTFTFTEKLQSAEISHITTAQLPLMLTSYEAMVHLSKLRKNYQLNANYLYFKKKYYAELMKLDTKEYILWLNL